ncbi:choline phosphate cytidylyltransferase [Exophiala xenobiotica]|uniref:ethanolamine-phosphate cytidylyltransferase n=1 Tax=Lithohypha guttulata TaxID=1690604 RepID=A0ABR0KAG4_9EURO|nr:choline phosphate cytidylyltransferase [Lithohypha guttulata]KAK5318857.1 choline phosphate cytidylyltransferase [Exophiala xenobiotica]
MAEEVPKPGQWPADPQQDEPEVLKERIWVDGCFDFAHHGHAGAMLQARQLGKELYVGVHSDEAITENKGPTVMTLDERVAAVDACRWATKPIPYAPYVTSLPWISHYGCYYVVHGDDITSDASGEDCYRFVKAANRFLVVKRTPGISTTDLVGRMLLCTKAHFIRSLKAELESGNGPELLTRLKDYASDESGLQPGSEVYTWHAPQQAQSQPSADGGHLEKLVSGRMPRQGQRIVYVDGGFDLFSSGHIEFLKRVSEAERGEAYVIAGIHNDALINQYKGLNYPIMNIFERGLCVLQCKYVHAVVFGAPFAASNAYLEALGKTPLGKVSAVYHGPTAFIPLDFDPYGDARALGLLKQIPDHSYKHVNAAEIMARIERGRAAFAERQRRKGQKASLEDVLKAAEIRS